MAGLLELLGRTEDRYTVLAPASLHMGRQRGPVDLRENLRGPGTSAKTDVSGRLQSICPVGGGFSNFFPSQYKFNGLF